MTTPHISVKNVKKNFVVGRQVVEILHGVSVDIQAGEFAIIFGPSGCGKSTMLHTILGLEAPTSGGVELLGKELYDEGSCEDDRSLFRKQHIGMVYQQPNWVKSLHVGENVAFPLILLGVPRAEALQQAQTTLQQVDMAEWADYYPSELSSGQQQRVSLARSFVHDPEMIIADEPTGNLDFDSGQEMMALLGRLNTEKKKTIVMVTHDLEYLPFASMAIHMFDGQIEGVYRGDEKTQLLKQLHSKRGTGTVA